DPEAFGDNMANRSFARHRIMTFGPTAGHVQQGALGDDLEAVVMEERNVACKLHELDLPIVDTARGSYRDRTPVREGQIALRAVKAHKTLILGSEIGRLRTHHEWTALAVQPLEP